MISHGRASNQTKKNMSEIIKKNRFEARRHANDFSAVLLAAGLGSRLQNQPKCLLRLDGEALICRQIQALLKLGLNQLIVVLGHHKEAIRSAIEGFPVTLIENPKPDSGQVSSLRIGLQAVKPSNNTLVSLSDLPLIGGDDLSNLVHAYSTRPLKSRVLVPTYKGLPGNPVIFDSHVRSSILASSAEYGCKQWQSENLDEVYHWVTTNDHYRIDIDNLEDIENFALLTGRHLRWPNLNQV